MTVIGPSLSSASDHINRVGLFTSRPARQCGKAEDREADSEDRIIEHLVSVEKRNSSKVYKRGAVSPPTMTEGTKKTQPLSTDTGPTHGRNLVCTLTLSVVVLRLCLEICFSIVLTA